MDINQNIFYTIKDFDNYKIDKCGNIYSVKTHKLLKPHLSYGYYAITFIKEGKQYHKYLHRLLAETFIPNPNNYPCINHRDENKLNNKLDNLEWCSYKYNNSYNNLNKRRGKAISATIHKNGGPHNKGKHISEETRQKISNSCKGRGFFGNQYVHLQNASVPQRLTGLDL